MFIQQNSKVEVITKNNEEFTGILTQIVINDEHEKYDAVLFISEKEPCDFGQACVFLQNIKTIEVTESV